MKHCTCEIQRRDSALQCLRGVILFINVFNLNHFEVADHPIFLRDSGIFHPVHGGLEVFNTLEAMSYASTIGIESIPIWEAGGLQTCSIAAD